MIPVITSKNIEQHPEFENSIIKTNEINEYIINSTKMKSHNHHHIHYLIRDLMGKDAKIYVEIGSYFGSSMALNMQLKNDWTFYGIDNFSAKDATKGKLMGIIDKFNIYQHPYAIINGNSSDSKIINRISKIDFLYIDGEHSYTQCLQDFLNYASKINSRGIIVFDDSYFGPVQKVVQDLFDTPLSELSDKRQWQFDIKEIQLIRKSYRKLNRINSSKYFTHKLTSPDDKLISQYNWQMIIQKKE